MSARLRPPRRPRGAIAAPQRSLVAALTAVLLLGAGVGACADGDPPHGPTTATGGVGLVPTAPAIAGLVSIRVELAETRVAGAPGDEFRVGFRALGAFDDGRTEDVTERVAVSSSIAEGTRLDVKAGTATLASTTPGEHVVRAAAGSVQGEAAVVFSVTGEARAPGLETPQAAFDEDPTATARVVYPPDGALLPETLDFAYQLETTSTFTEALVRYRGTAVEFDLVAPCLPMTDGCRVPVPGEVRTLLAGVSQADELTTEIRLRSADGSNRAVADPVDVRVAFGGPAGALFYWRSNGRQTTPDEPIITEIARLELAVWGDSEAVWSQPTDTVAHPLRASPWPGAPEEQRTAPCVGCHAVSPDGSRLAMSVGGSDAASFALVDVASRSLIDFRVADGLNAEGFAQFTTFNPAGDRIVQSHDGSLFLRDAAAGFEDLGFIRFPGVLFASHPYWGRSHLTFVAYDQVGTNRNSDLVPGARIWIADSDGRRIDVASAREVVPRAEGRTRYFPSLSADDRWLAFVESRCAAPAPATDYGSGACDGYDDISAELRLISAEGEGTVMTLPRLNGGENLSNSWPRFSRLPPTTTFRGNPVYWVAFSSRRPCGLSVNRNADPLDPTTPPQLWIGALALPVAGPVDGDVSFAPFRVPRQNPADAAMPLVTGNHVPQWTRRFVE